MRFVDDPIRVGGALTRAEVESTARLLARTIESYVEGARDLVGTWVSAAMALGAKVVCYKDKGGDPGFYNWKNATIYYNKESPAPLCIRYIVHELAHHLLAQWRWSPLRRGIERYDDDRNTVQHRIARRVEQMVMGESD